MPKDYEDYKPYKDDSKHKGREQDHSRSSSSSASPSSRSSREEKRELRKKGKKRFAGVSRPRGTFHDDRDDGVDYWAKRGRGCGTFQHGRGRFNFKISGSSPKWTHDKYQGDGIVEDEEETMENNEEKKDRRKEEKE